MIQIDTTQRNWWRDLEPEDYPDRALIEYILGEMDEEIARLTVEVADADMMAKQGEEVDSEWYRALITVFHYAKSTRVKFRKALEDMNRDAREADRQAQIDRDERMINLLERVEAMLGPRI